MLERVAIYHFSVKIVSRSDAKSAVAAAAYRSGTRLREHRTGIVFDFSQKRGVQHTEILAPENAPAWMSDRSALWNTVEEVEKRCDAQLARDLEIALPTELNDAAQVDLLRDFVRREFVTQGMVADCAIHRDNPNNPHAHVLLTLRRIGPNGFGLKERTWNSRSNLLAWRVAWSEVANKHLSKAGFSVQIDHRTLKAQGLDLIPGRKIGVGLDRQNSSRLPPRIADRVAEQRAIAAENGVNIVADPSIAIKALRHYQTTFTEHDIAKFLHTRTDGAQQFRQAFSKVTTSPDLVFLGADDHGRKRYTRRELPELPGTTPQKSRPRSFMDEIDAMQQRGAEKWRDKQLVREKGDPAAHVEWDQADGPPSDPDSAQHLDKQIQQKPLEPPAPEDDLEL